MCSNMVCECEEMVGEEMGDLLATMLFLSDFGQERKGLKSARATLPSG